MTLMPIRGTGRYWPCGLIRLFSVLLGAVTVYLTYRIGREAAPERPEIAFGAAAVNAFLPMFLFISGAVNNDNLAVPLTSLALLMMIRIVTARTGDGYRPVAWRLWLVLGLVIGLAVLTKEGTLGLLPMALGTAFVGAWQWLVRAKPDSMSTQRVWPAVGRFAAALVLVVLPVLVVAGWWYYRNIVFYGDWLGWNAFIAVLGQRAVPASLAQLWGERQGFLMSFWGLFGGVNIPMSLWIYTVLNAILLLSVVGFFVYAIQHVVSEMRCGALIVKLAGAIARSGRAQFRAYRLPHLQCGGCLWLDSMGHNDLVVAGAAGLYGHFAAVSADGVGPCRLDAAPARSVSLSGVTGFLFLVALAAPSCGYVPPTSRQRLRTTGQSG